MRLLDRYLLRELLTPLGFCLGGFLVFWVAFEMLGDLEDFQQQQVPLVGVLQLYWLRLPELLLTVVPFALLLALLHTLTGLAKHHELTAIRAAGVSLWRICAPYFAVGVLAGGALFALNEYWMPDAKEREEHLRLAWKGQARTAESAWQRNVNFQNNTDGHNWNIGAFNPVTGELRQPRVALFLSRAGHREIHADAVRWTNGYWLLANGVEILHRREEDTAPARKAKRLLTTAEMGGSLAEVSRWEGRSLWLTNEVLTNGYVVLTNLVRADSAKTTAWELGWLRPDTGEGGALRFRGPLGERARRLVFADAGVWTNGSWTFFGVQEFLYRSATDDNYLDQTNAVLALPELNEHPAMLRSELRVGSILNAAKLARRPLLGSREILDYLHLHPELPARDRAVLETQLQARYAGPWTCLVVVLIAIPFGAQSGRRNLFYGVAGSLVIAFSYFVLQTVGFALGQGNQVPSWLGAWLPNLLFTVTGVVLMARVR